MTDSSKTNLIILGEGGWAEDLDEDSDEEVDTQRFKSWGQVEKPAVVPIGTDFDINTRKKDTQSHVDLPDYYARRDFGSNRSHGDHQRYGDSGYRRSGFGDRRDSGFRRDSNRYRRDEYGDYSPTILKRGEFSSVYRPVTRSQPRESPFGGARPIDPQTIDQKERKRVIKREENPFGDAKPTVPLESPDIKKKKEENPFGEAKPTVPKIPSDRGRYDRRSSRHSRGKDPTRFRARKFPIENQKVHRRREQQGKRQSDLKKPFRKVSEPKKFAPSKGQLNTEKKSEQNVNTINRFSLLGEDEDLS